jgi:hypothetical protein
MMFRGVEGVVPRVAWGSKGGGWVDGGGEGDEGEGECEGEGDGDENGDVEGEGDRGTWYM